MPFPRGVVNRGSSVAAAPAVGSCGDAGVEVADDIPDAGERAAVEKRPRVLELTQRQAAELVDVLGVPGDLGSARVFSVIRGGVVPRRRIQRLDRVIADTDVGEVLFDELSDARDVRIVRLFVEHRSAVATKAASAAVLGLGEKELGTAQLACESRRCRPPRGTYQTECSG